MSITGGKGTFILNMDFSEFRKKLAHKTVGIAGCGGLGSNCAMSLARIGTGTLVLADFDIVSQDNLNRQYYFFDQVGKPKVEMLRDNILRINQGTRVVIHPVRLTAGNIPRIFGDCDVIVEAFDMAEQKELLIETVLTVFPGKPLVIGLGMAGWGMSDTLHVRQSDNLYICGDEISEIGPDLPPIAPRVGIVANMQANVVAEILLSTL
jgi:sulfur carrier protein ThiS adenylyltransferase